MCTCIDSPKNIEEEGLQKRENLAPALSRQRVVIELQTENYVSKEKIESYLIALSKTCYMQPVDGPYVYRCGEKGFGGWIHRTTSGAHIYSYPPEKTQTPYYLISVDAYTCKSFDSQQASLFTKKYFAAIKLVYKNITV